MTQRLRCQRRVHQWACLPLCRVCFPPESTPLGSMPVGVRPFSVSTLSLSSLQRYNGGGGDITFYFLSRKRSDLQGKNVYKNAHWKKKKNSHGTLPWLPCCCCFPLFYLEHTVFSHIHIEVMLRKWHDC